MLERRELLRLVTLSAAIGGSAVLTPSGVASAADRCRITTYRGREVKICPGEQPADGLLSESVFIDGVPLLVMVMAGHYGKRHYMSVINAHEEFGSLADVANAAVDALRGAKLRRLSLTKLDSEWSLPPFPSVPAGEKRVRRAAGSLSPAGRKHYVDAVLAFKQSGGYDAFAERHLLSDINSATWGVHGYPSFLPWHRLFVYHFESCLRQQPGFADLTIPYWDYSPEVSPFTEDFMGGAGQPVETGQFSYPAGKWPIVISPHFGIPWLVRDGSPPGPPLSNVEGVLGSPDYAQMRRSIESLHDKLHSGTGGNMRGSASPNDPVFWVLHAMIDKLWADWQDLHPDTPHFDKGNGPVGMHDALQPWRQDLGLTFRPADLLDFHKFATYA